MGPLIIHMYFVCSGLPKGINSLPFISLIFPAFFFSPLRVFCFGQNFPPLGKASSKQCLCLCLCFCFPLQSFPCFPSTMAWWCHLAASWTTTVVPSLPPQPSPSPLPARMKGPRRRRSTAACHSPAQVGHLRGRHLYGDQNPA